MTHDPSNVETRRARAFLSRRAHVALGLSLVGISLASCRGGESPSLGTPVPELLFTDSPSTWVPPLPELRVSRDERWAAFGSGTHLKLVDLRAGSHDEARKLGELDDVTGIVFGVEGEPVRHGRLNGQAGWYRGATGVEELPADAVARWSPDGTRVAFYRPGEPRHVSFDSGGVALDGNIRALEWSADGALVLALVTHESGASSLLRVRPEDGHLDLVASELDVPLRGASLGIAPGGDTVYLPLASPGSLDLVARHTVDADRDLDIYEMSLATGEKTLRVETPMDELSPRVAGESLYWARVSYRQSIVALPIDGGEAHLVAEDGQIPYWSHDGRRVAYTVGLPRASDAPLNMDADAVEVDDDAQPISAPVRLIDGFHEDFTPAWSPDGRWLAFHSHRSPTPVPSYAAEGATDDLFLLRSGDSTENEIRLTDFGWEVGMADWSRDGRRLAFVSWEEGAAGIGVPFILTIDPQTGEALELERLGLPEPLRSARLVAWSPVADADVIAIENDDGDGRQTIYTLDLTSGALEKIVTFVSDTYSGLDWTPDGETIVYAARAEEEDGGRYQIFAVARTSGTPRRLSRDTGELLQPQVSPDGRFIAATRIEMERELWRLRR